MELVGRIQSDAERIQCQSACSEDYEGVALSTNPSHSLTRSVCTLGLHRYPAIAPCRFQGKGGVPLGMQAMKSEYLDPDLSDRSVSADILVRKEPDEDEEEDENEGR